jgi:hypothetical protein
MRRVATIFAGTASTPALAQRHASIVAPQAGHRRPAPVE